METAAVESELLVSQVPNGPFCLTNCVLFLILLLLADFQRESEISETD